MRRRPRPLPPRVVFALVSSAVFALLASAAPAPAVAGPDLKLSIDKGDIDVEGRTIHFSLGTVAASAEVQVFSPEGELLHVGNREYDEPPPGTRLSIGWPDLGEKGENFRLELKITDTGGYWVTTQVIRFYLEVPHEEVVFESGKWDIRPQEAHKLDKPLALLKDAVARYAKLMDVKLYVTGHTDTVGKAADNQRLSEKRAEAIAQHFIRRGLEGLPIFVRGFGEGALAVKTADNVDEVRNRRAEYIISSFVPELSGPGSWRRVQ